MNCTQCGTPLAEGARFCQSCGKDSGWGGGADGFETRTPPPPPARDARYGGFWRRVAASVIDGLVLAGVSILLVVVGTVALMASSDPEGTAARYEIFYYLVSYVVGWLYFAFMHSSELQASLGKRALGIKVTDLAGRRISFGHGSLLCLPRDEHRHVVHRSPHGRLYAAAAGSSRHDRGHPRRQP